MRHSVCTSFSPEGYRIYGKRFIETFIQYWPADVGLMVVYEHELPEVGRDDPRITFRDLFDDERWMEFRQRFKHDPKVDSKDPTFGAMKWARKVFALAGEQYESDWLIWLDGDVETTRYVDDDFFAAVLPDDKFLSFLDRRHYRYSECGFVGYNVTYDDVRTLLANMLEWYQSGRFTELAEYGDSYVFDVCRRMIFGPTNVRDFMRLGEGCKGTHVWPQSVLRHWFVHSKGPRRKLETYGGAC